MITCVISKEAEKFDASLSQTLIKAVEVFKLLVILFAFVYVWPRMCLDMARILFPILFSQLGKPVSICKKNSVNIRTFR